MIKIGNLNIDRKDLVCTAVLLLILLVSSIVVCLKVNTIILKVWLIIITIYIYWALLAISITLVLVIYSKISETIRLNIYFF